MTDDRAAALQTHLDREIAAAQASAKKQLAPEDVATIVRQVIKSLDGDVTAADLKFYSELEELARYIRHAREEIAAIRPNDIKTDHIPRATDELDAVVGATEEATNKIMDVCDEIAAIANECAAELKDKLVACTTRIFEACNFQDITGQRITKVVGTLKHIEAQIEALLVAMGDEGHAGAGAGGSDTMAAAVSDADKALLHGPQLPKDANDQASIDRLFSGS